MKWSAATAALILLALSPLLLSWATVRSFLESQMTLHMLVQFPWLFVCGAAAMSSCSRSSCIAVLLGKCDDRGLFAVTLVLCVSAFWMIPSALDMALLDDRVRLAKYFSWYAAGVMFSSAVHRLGHELWAFFLGNVVWMLATAGWLIRDTEAQLCVSYLVRDQYWTGTGLIVVSVALLAWSLNCYRVKLRQLGELA